MRIRHAHANVNTNGVRNAERDDDNYGCSCDQEIEKYTCVRGYVGDNALKKIMLLSERSIFCSHVH